MNIFVGDFVDIDNERRTVTSLLKNAHGGSIIVWQGRKSSEGACIPSVWEDWKTGKDRNKRS